jgi:hypothetical protein
MVCNPLLHWVVLDCNSLTKTPEESNRFNLSGGKTGLVFNITRDWITGQVQIGVLV